MTRTGSPPGLHQRAASLGETVAASDVEVPSREGYRALLSGSREMRRDHAIAREAWFAALAVDRKEDLLFELEVLLKGLACFANPRNHAGPPRHASIVSLDFARPLAVARDGISRVLALTRILLAEDDRLFIFQRYLEHVIPEDSARVRFVRATASQETPDDSLVALRHACSHVLELARSLSHLSHGERINYRTFHALLGLMQREVARNSFFNPIRALEFRPEFDRLRNAEVYQIVQNVLGEEPHRLVALAVLSLYRMLRYLELIETMGRAGQMQRAYLVFAALRSDARALAGFLHEHAGQQLAEGFEREVFAHASASLHHSYESLLAEGHRLLGIRASLDGVAAKLRIELRRTFERDIPAMDDAMSAVDLRDRMQKAVEGLRPALQNTLVFLFKSLSPRVDEDNVFDDRAARRESSERLRRDVWMFAQIVRGFAAKAAGMRGPDQGDRWASVDTFRFVQEFLRYFRAMGYPLLRANDYPRMDAFLGAMSTLVETDLLDPSRMQAVVAECEQFQSFLMELFDNIGRRDELAATPFDRKAAAEALRLYLSNA